MIAITVVMAIMAMIAIIAIIAITRLLGLYDGNSLVEHGVMSHGGLCRIKVDSASLRGIDPGFGAVALRIQERTCREAYTPTTRQLGRHRHSAATTGGGPYNGDRRQKAHHGHKVIGGAEGRAVTQHHYGFEPPHASGIGCIIIIGVRFGKVAMPRPGLMYSVSGKGTSRDKAPYKGFDIGHIATTVVTHVNNQALSYLEVR